MKDHWENIYSNKKDQEVSWYEENPQLSLSIIETYLKNKDEAIIDIGTGNSNLLQKLNEKGFSNLTGLDISAAALKRNKNKADPTQQISYIISDVLDHQQSNTYDVWHDRAVFHFINSPESKNQYKSNLISSLKSGAFFILSTFSKSGPLKCSGLEITQYDEKNLKDLFSDELELIEIFESVHTTPFDTEQNFINSIWKKP